MLAECVAYTFEQARLSCNLHSSIQMGQRYTRGKQTGRKKPDYILSIPEMSFCSEKNRKRRCRWEPKCENVNCLRKAFLRGPISHTTIFYVPGTTGTVIADQFSRIHGAVQAHTVSALEMGSRSYAVNEFYLYYTSYNL